MYCYISVRLACIRHAASVHPEPGSNSPQKIYRLSTLKSFYGVRTTGHRFTSYHSSVVKVLIFPRRRILVAFSRAVKVFRQNYRWSSLALSHSLRTSAGEFLEPLFGLPQGLTSIFTDLPFGKTARSLRTYLYPLVLPLSRAFEDQFARFTCRSSQPTSWSLPSGKLFNFERFLPFGATGCVFHSETRL